MTDPTITIAGLRAQIESLQAANRGHEHRPFCLLGVTASGAYVVRDPKAVGK